MTGSPPADRVSLAIATYACVVFAVLWMGLALALILDDGWLDDAWNWLRGVPIVPQVVIWALLLPIAVALWVWQADWSPSMRILGFLVIAAWTLVAINSVRKLKATT